MKLETARSQRPSCPSPTHPPPPLPPHNTVGAGLALPPIGNPGAGVPLALIGAFLASRTQKVRFVFDEEALEVMTVEDGELALSGENFAVSFCGGIGRL